MSQRRCFLDRGFGENRGVITLGGRPERLIIEREGDLAVQALGARVAARVRSIERAQGLAFIDLGEGPDAVLNLGTQVGPVVQGAWLDIEIASQARGNKGAKARWHGPADGPTRLLASGPSIEARLSDFARGCEIEIGPAARVAADAAQDEAMETEFALPGGGSIAVESTRALIAVDVDVGARSGGEAKRVARAANLAAISETARVLRLKGLGGLVVIDLAGRGHDAPTILASARASFAADNPGVAVAPVSRFGTLELTVPRRARPTLEVLCDDTGALRAETSAMAMVRTLEREAQADRGGRFEALAPPAVAQAATAALAQLNARLGGRLSVRAEPGHTGFQVASR